MSSINARVPPLRLMAVDTPADGEIPSYQSSSGDFEWVADAGASFPLLGTDGSAAAPTYSFASSTECGMYLKGTNELGFSTASTDYLTMTGDTVNVPGNVKLRIGDGAATTPTLSFIDNTDLGFYRPSLDILGFTADGAERLRFGAAGQIGIEGANYGTSGQVFSSGGSGAKPTWEDGGMASFNVAGDTGATQTITNGNTLTIKNAAGGAIKTVGVATDELTIDLTVSGVSAASYTSTDLTVDAQGRITAASSGSGGSAYLANLGSLSTLSGETRYEISCMPPYSGTPGNVVNYSGVNWKDSLFAFPFIAKVSGQLSELGVKFGSSSGGLEVAIYDSNSDQLPGSLLGSGTFTYALSYQEVYDTSLTAPSSGTVGSLVQGSMYWACYLRLVAGTATLMASGCSSTERAASMQVTGPTDTDGGIYVNDDYAAGDTFPDTLDNTNAEAASYAVPKITFKV